METGVRKTSHANLTMRIILKNMQKRKLEILLTNQGRDNPNWEYDEEDIGLIF